MAGSRRRAPVPFKHKTKQKQPGFHERRRRGGGGEEEGEEAALCCARVIGFCSCAESKQAGSYFDSCSTVDARVLAERKVQCTCPTFLCIPGLIRENSWGEGAQKQDYQCCFSKDKRQANLQSQKEKEWQWSRKPGHGGALELLAYLNTDDKELWHCEGGAFLGIGEGGGVHKVGGKVLSLWAEKLVVIWGWKEVGSPLPSRILSQALDAQQVELSAPRVPRLLQDGSAQHDQEGQAGTSQQQQESPVPWRGKAKQGLALPQAVGQRLLPVSHKLDHCFCVCACVCATT